MSDTKTIAPVPASTDDEQLDVFGSLTSMVRELERPSPAARRCLQDVERDAGRAGKLVVKAIASEDGASELARAFFEAIAQGVAK